MAAANVSAFEVSTFFINQYYRVLQESPEYSHRFYSDLSTMTRVDGDDTHSVSTMEGIHAVLISLNITGVEVTKLNYQDSWNGGILLIVSGFVKSRNFSGKRKFTQVFFLAPQEKGYFVLNDVLQFHDEVLVNQHPVHEIPDIKVDSEVHTSSPHLEQPVSSYEFEEETREYVNSLHIEEDSPIDKYSIPDEQQSEEHESETVVGEAPVEESLLESAVNHVNHVDDSIRVPTNEPASEPSGEPAKKSYASILREKGLSNHLVVSQPPVRRSMPPSLPLEQQQSALSSAPQLNPSASSFVPEAAGSEDSPAQEVEPTSVYVKNLPSNVTNADLEEEFKKFGKIKPDGVDIKSKKEIGVFFAFVEFEDLSGVHNAIKASPIELLGRRIYIEGRRSSNSAARGGVTARGRGRGGGPLQNETSRGRGGFRNSGRGSGLDGNNYNGVRGNGYQQRSYQ